MKKKLLISIIAASVSVLLAAGIILGFCISSGKKTTRIGFYDIPESYQASIKKAVSDCQLKKVKYIQLTEKIYTKSAANKKADILFSYTDSCTQNYLEKAVPLDSSILARIPGSIKSSSYYKNSNSQTAAMPVLVDNFETSVLKTTFTKYNIPWARKTSELMDFGTKAKNFYPAPIILAGDNDINVLSFFTEMIIAYGGKAAYEEMKSQIQKAENFEDLTDMEFTSFTKEKIKVKEVFDFYKELQRKGYLISNWTRLTEKACNNLIDDNRIGVILMNLSENRKKTMPNIYYYVVTTFPVETETKELTVQPVINCMVFKDKESSKLILDKLSTAEVQERLSVETKLGPATLKGAPCDKQADEARYLAASTQFGPVPDLGTAALKTKEKRHQLAEAIRAHFE